MLKITITDVYSAVMARLRYKYCFSSVILNL